MPQANTANYDLFRTKDLDEPLENSLNDAISGTFAHNTKLPVHRWYRYSAGFSAEWVRSVLESHPDAQTILDPFAGSGTVLIEAEKLNRQAIGIEAQPLVARIAQAKLAWRSDPERLGEIASRIVTRARRLAEEVTVPASPFLDKCLSPLARRELEALKQTLHELTDGGQEFALCWLAFITTIRASSHVGTAQWQYVLPNRTKARVVAPIDGFVSKLVEITRDVVHMQPLAGHSRARVVAADSRTEQAAPDGWADLVITSPPYANNYDYADSTRLEFMVLGEIAGWGDLQDVVRTGLVRACTQHVKDAVDQALASKALEPIRPKLAEVLADLKVLGGTRAGKKPYHLMLACYLIDMADVMTGLRRQLRPGGRMCFVIGDSAPYGVHAPIDVWLGEIALGAGFQSFSFEKIRDRNVKWKNRKHRFPLHEGRLWIEG